MTDTEINEAVARKLGWKWRNYDPDSDDLLMRIPCYTAPNGDIYANSPDYCHSIAAAWEIMEKHDIALFKTKEGHWCTYTNFGLSEESEDEWYFSAEDVHWTGSPIGGGITVADTASMAICLAFLKLGMNDKATESRGE